MVEHATCCNGIVWWIGWNDPPSRANYSILWKGSTTFAPPGVPLDPANVGLAQAFADIASSLVPLSSLPGSWARVADWPTARDPSIIISMAPQFPADNRLYHLRGTNIFRSATQGRMWELFSTILDCKSPVAPRPQGLSLQFSPTFQSDNTMLVFTDMCKPQGAQTYFDLFISRDGGQTWSPVDSPLSSELNALGVELKGAVFSPTFSPDHRTWLFNSRAIVQSTDGARSWSQVGWPLRGASLLGFAASGSSSGSPALFVFMHDSTREPAARYFRSTDLGQAWQEITEAFRDPTSLQLPYLTFGTTAGVSPVYATTQGGSTWLSTDAGATWILAFPFPPAVATADGCLIFNLGSVVGDACDAKTQIETGSAAPAHIDQIVSVQSFQEDGRVLVNAGDALWTYKVR